MRKIFILFAVFIIISGASSAQFNWPVKTVVFTSQFGESRTDHWHNGVDIISGNQYELRAPADGELIFYRDTVDSPMPDKFGAGNLLVLEHERNLRTFYYHLEDGTIIKTKNKVTSEDVIAAIGNSGKSSGPHLHLSLYSTVNDRILNPIDYFPGYSDEKKPVIQKILLKGPLSDYVNIMKNKRIRSKRYFRVIVVANDVQEGSRLSNAPLGVREIKLFIDGKLIKQIQFNFLELKEKKYCLNGDIDMTFERFYLDEAYYMDIAGFVPTMGTHEFLVAVKDNTRQTAEKSVSVTFY